MVHNCLGSWLLIFCMLLPKLQGSDIREVSCGKSPGTFSIMGLVKKCRTEQGSYNCENMGLFGDQKKECYKCCNNTVATAKPPTVLFTAKLQTPWKILTTKTVPTTEKMMTKKRSPPYVKEVEATSWGKLVLIGSLCIFAVTVVALAVFLFRRHRRSRNASGDQVSYSQTAAQTMDQEATSISIEDHLVPQSPPASQSMQGGNRNYVGTPTDEVALLQMSVDGSNMNNKGNPTIKKIED